VGIESYKIMDIIFVVGICHPSVGVADRLSSSGDEKLLLEERCNEVTEWWQY